MRTSLDSHGLRKLLPYVYPFLLIDYIEYYTAGKTITAVKNITVNEWPFTDAGCQLTFYPETLLIEAAAQSALALYYLTFAVAQPRFSPIIGRVYASFSAQVMAGDNLKLKVAAEKFLRQAGCATINIFSMGSQCAEVKLLYGVRGGSLW